MHRQLELLPGRVVREPEGCAAAAATALMPLVYEQLLGIARQRMRREPPEQTLQPTALVHEAYVRLVGTDAERLWDSRWHFMAAAAEAMRRILVERARRRRSVKHGGALHRTELQDVPLEVDGHATDLLALDAALTKLADRHPEKARLVELRYFAGLTAAEAAQAMGLSGATVDRYWAFAKAWLFREVGP
jgi:RNA polymerase sigma factor (TIGR02999 family)